jgi:hypothetical protein
MRPPAWLVAAALALYPPHVRRRYGEEIVDLLAHSPRPWRDLTNVAWNATLERFGTVRRAPLRPYAARMSALLFAPMMFHIAVTVGMPVSSILAGAIGALVGRGTVSVSGDAGLQAGFEDGPLVGSIAVVVTVIAVLGVRAARLWTDALRLPALPVVVPAMVVLGAAGTTVAQLAYITLANVPMDDALDPAWVAVPVSTVLWWILLTALVTRHRGLVRQGRTAAARLVVVAATAVTAGMCMTVHLLATGPQPPVTFLLMTGFTPLATACTPFAFALMRVAHHQEAAAGG